MLLRRIFNRNFVNNAITRNCSFKPIKRPSMTNVSLNEKLISSADPKSAASLAKQLSTKILATGPITVAEYMKEVLTNPLSGYYMLKDVFGEKGDFITSPEIGQIFGELVAVWCLAEWEKIGCPEPLQLVELGPGRGTLAQDVLRVLSRFDLSQKISVHLVEVSPHLSKMQAQRLCCEFSEPKEEDGPVAYYRRGETISGVQVFWYRKVEDVPKAFSIFLAHEFFDAMPVHKFQKNEAGKWREILIDIDPKKENGFRYVITKSPTPDLSVFLTRNWSEDFLKGGRDHVEYSHEIESVIETISSNLQESGGFALIMDYGHSGDKGDTFRGFKQHSLHDPLVDPGTADLTADVDFKSLKLISEQNGNLIAFGPIDQREFLTRMGGEIRLKSLLENASSPESAENVQSGYEMLTNPAKMGSRFKFFALFPRVLKEHLAKFPVNGFDQGKQNNIS